MTETQLVNEGLLGCEMQDIGKDESLALTTLILLEAKMEDDSILDSVKNDVGVIVIQSRLDAVNTKATLPLIAFLSILCEGIPGRMSTWVYTLSVMLSRSESSIMTIFEWSSTFRSGVPSNESYLSVWKTQKCRSELTRFENAYDDASLYPTMTAKEPDHDLSD